MEARKLIEILKTAERLKDTARHCYTSKGCRESVAEHSWMMTLMAFFMRDEFPDADMDKVAATGDIPAFEKTEADEEREERLLMEWVSSLPDPYAEKMKSLYEEMADRSTLEAKIYKAIDSLEAVLQHNLSDLSTWLPMEYELNQTYGEDKTAFSEYMRELRREAREDTVRKIREGK